MSRKRPQVNGFVPDLDIRATVYGELARRLKELCPGLVAKLVMLAVKDRVKLNAAKEPFTGHLGGAVHFVVENGKAIGGVWLLCGLETGGMDEIDDCGPDAVTCPDCLALRKGAVARRRAG